MIKQWPMLSGTVCLAGWLALVAGGMPLPRAAAQDVSAEQVVDRYFEAIGGRDRLAAVRTMETKGKMEIPEAGVTGTFVQRQQAPNLSSMRVEMEGAGTQQSGFDGETGWEISEMNGPRVLAGRELLQAQVQSPIFPLWNHEQNFDSIRVAGSEKFAGQDCTVLVAEKQGIDPIRFYFSGETGLLAGSAMKVATQVGELDIVSELSDYREIDGVKVPMKGVARVAAFGISQVLTNESVTINGDLPEDAFALPEEIRKLKGPAGSDGGK